MKHIFISFVFLVVVGWSFVESQVSNGLQNGYTDPLKQHNSKVLFRITTVTKNATSIPIVPLTFALAVFTQCLAKYAIIALL
jgi:hypothetical protein